MGSPNRPTEVSWLPNQPESFEYDCGVVVDGEVRSAEAAREVVRGPERFVGATPGGDAVVPFTFVDDVVERDVGEACDVDVDRLDDGDGVALGVDDSVVLAWLRERFVVGLVFVVQSRGRGFGSGENRCDQGIS